MGSGRATAKYWPTVRCQRRGREVAENLDQFLGGFAESDHHATLGYMPGENFLAFSSSVRVRW